MVIQVNVWLCPFFFFSFSVCLHLCLRNLLSLHIYPNRCATIICKQYMNVYEALYVIIPTTTTTQTYCLHNGPFSHIVYIVNYEHIVLCSLQFCLNSGLRLLLPGHLLAPVLCHSFCNSMGFPDFSRALEHPQRPVLLLCYQLGVALFLLCLLPLTDPFFYGVTPICTLFLNPRAVCSWQTWMEAKKDCFQVNDMWTAAQQIRQSVSYLMVLPSGYQYYMHGES